MNEERETRFSMGDVEEISLDDEQKKIFKTWEQIGSDLAMYSRMAGKSIIEINNDEELAGLFGDYILRINLISGIDENEPEVINTYILQRPEQEGEPEVFIDLNSVRIDWEDNKPEVMSIGGVSWESSKNIILNQQILSMAVRNLVSATISSYHGNPFSNEPQTDLMS